EGMRRGVVTVSEKGDGGDVNSLALDNRSDKPLFLMSGEVVLGGQQDRIIGRDTIIPPKHKQNLPLYLLEHGRWNGEARFRAGGAMAHPKLRAQADFAGQSEVWREVADKNAKRGVANATGTYRNVAEGAADKDVAAYQSHVGDALAALPRAD